MTPVQAERLYPYLPSGMYTDPSRGSAAAGLSGYRREEKSVAAGQREGKSVARARLSPKQAVGWGT